MNKIKHKKSILTRSILIFLLIAFPIFVLGMYIFMQEKDMLIKQYEISVENQVSNYFAQVEKNIQNIKKQQDTLIYDNDFCYLLNKDIFNYDVSRSINSVGTKISLIQESSGYINEVLVYVGSLGNSIAAKNQRIKYSEPDYEKIKGILENNNKYFLEYYDHQLYIMTLPISYQSAPEKLQYMIYTEISLDKLYEDIRSFEMDDQAMSILSFDAYDIQWMDNADSALFEPILGKSSGERPCVSAYEKIDGENYFVIEYYSQYLQARCAQAIPVKVMFRELDQLRKWYYVFFIVIFLAILVYSIYTYEAVKKPLNKLIDSFSMLEKEQFDVRILEHKSDEFELVFASFNHMAEKLGSLINDVYMKKILIQRAELRQLQAQINPHFLYNSFFILKNKIAGEHKPEAEQFCEMLGIYFSYITKNYKEYSTLQEEVRHAKIYADIQSIRFGERIEITFEELPEQFAQRELPKLILQPIIENAFKYGLENVEFDGKLLVHYDVEGHHLNIIVEDNGEGLGDHPDKLHDINDLFENYQQIREPSGLFNINRRIKILYGDKSGLIVEQSRLLGGLKVILSLDFDEGPAVFRDGLREEGGTPC